MKITFPILTEKSNAYRESQINHRISCPSSLSIDKKQEPQRTDRGIYPLVETVLTRGHAPLLKITPLLKVAPSVSFIHFHASFRLPALLCPHPSMRIFQHVCGILRQISLRRMKELFKDNPGFNGQETLAGMNSFFPELKRWM
jgi:hypothetical protein